MRAALPEHDSIVHHGSYFFASVDPDGEALALSRTGRRHCTAALRHDRPLRGVIDYGCTRVTPEGARKHLDGHRGVFEIDVRGYLREQGLLDKIPRKLPGVAREADAVVHRRPDFHAAEIARREEDVLAVGARVIRAAAPELTAELRAPSEDLLPELLAVEHAAFPQEIRYDEGFFRLRFLHQRAEFLLLRDARRLVAFALTYRTLLRPQEELYLDDVAVLPEYQSRGLGTGILKTIAGLGTVRGCTRIHALLQSGETTQKLVRFYERNGYDCRGDFQGLGIHVERSLGLFIPEHREVIDALLREAERRLSGALQRPKITLHTELDPELLRIILSLEAGFPDRLRYTAEQYQARMMCRDALILVAWEQGEPIGFANGFHDPAAAAHVFNQDSMIVRPDHQGRGIARELLLLLIGLPALAGYTTTLSYCEPKSPSGADLVEYYARFGEMAVDFNESRHRLLGSVRAPVTDCFTRYRKPGG